MYSLVIKNGKIIDGSGKSAFFADVAIKDGKIVKIGKIEGECEKIIDATGLVVTPGFIDSHSHNDNALVNFPDLVEKVEQGITTSIAGQCGASPAPSIKEDGSILKMSEFFDSIKDNYFGSSTMCLAGYKSIRKTVMGMRKDIPTENELKKMKELLRDALEAGAAGLSFGLIYPPCSYAKTEELVEMAKIVKEYNGIVSAHIRGEGNTVVESAEEFIDIVRQSGVRGVHSHMKVAGGPQNHGKSKDLLENLDKAVSDGVDIYADVYPYIASHTSLSVTIVPDSGQNLIERLKSEEERIKIREWNMTRWWKDDFSWVQIVKCTGYPEYQGMRVPDIAKLHGKNQLDTMLDLILESNDNCSACYFTMCEDDVENIISNERVMIGTDGGVKGNKSVFHPRVKGTFVRAISEYVRERKVVPLEEMIRKMTSLPAFVYGLEQKGLIKEGLDADICIFDENKIKDHSEYADCDKRADGFNYVIIGGEVVAENAVYCGKRCGRLLLKKR